MSTGYTADWLALREPADAAARSRCLMGELASALAAPLEVVDLAAGTGANARYLAPRLAGPQHWRLIDHDAELLHHARIGCSSLHAADGRAVTVAIECRDVADPDALDLDNATLITGSALLDLVGERWIARLAQRLQAGGAAALFALSYDGRIVWQPADAGDDAVRSAFNAHQRAQQPLAEPALGPQAAVRMVEALSAAGLEVHQESSDWQLGPADKGLLQQLIAGWVAAASEQEPASATAFADWGGRRFEQANAGLLGVRVGHIDLLALPANRATV